MVEITKENAAAAIASQAGLLKFYEEEYRKALKEVLELEKENHHRRMENFRVAQENAELRRKVRKIWPERISIFLAGAVSTVFVLIVLATIRASS